MSEPVPLSTPDLPALEAWLLRRGYFPWFRRARSFVEVTAEFSAEARHLEELAGLFTPDEFTRRVQVRRLFGLEHGETGWSAAMVIEHLIASGQLAGRILAFLRRGESPPFRYDRAAIRPAGTRGIAVMADWREFLADYRRLATEEAPPARGPVATEPHPWLGPLDAHGWHCYAMLHLQAHRRHLREIRRQLFREGGPATARDLLLQPAVNAPPSAAP